MPNLDVMKPYAADGSCIMDTFGNNSYYRIFPF